MQIFDYSQISDDGIRTEYRLARDRAYTIAQSVHRHYGAGKPPIAIHYIEENTFNAEATKDESGYLLLINHSVPLCHLMLFSKLLTDETMLPDIDASGSVASEFSTPALIDPADFSRRQQWDVKLNDARAFAASTLADICTTFVVCHELGHVMCGHVDGSESIDGESTLGEVVTFSRNNQEFYDRRQEWELDADAVAVTLLMNSVQESVDILAKEDTRLAMLFHESEYRIEHILGTYAAALFAFFSYLTGNRDQLSLQSTHPHPMVRSLYARDMIISAALERWEFDTEVVETVYFDRLAEIIVAAKKMSLLPIDILDDAFSDELNAQVEKLPALQYRFRSSCVPWCWFGWG